jgi:hypothetical protein
MEDSEAGAEVSNGVIYIYFQPTTLMRKISLHTGCESNSETLRHMENLT